MERRHRILIAEDHAILREGLRSLLSLRSELEVVGEAGDGLEAVAQARRLKPDLVLMDLSMPRLGGLDAVRQIVRRGDGTRVIVLTAHKTEEYVRAALEAGAVGYVLKDAGSEELLAAILGALRGEVFLGAEVRRMVRRAPRRAAGAPAVTAWDTVTPREREVMKLIAEGRRNREIAELLSISPRTVEKHRASLMEKLELRNASAIAVYAAQRGLVT
jgi:DNA-binding NarL/FixJ family response regulator